MEQTHDIAPRPTFDKAWERQRYHRRQREIEENWQREQRANERMERNGRDARGATIEPVNYTPEERRDRDRILSKGMREASTFIRSSHGRVGERSTGY